jgi:L,D-transpeptidase catalytic domain
MLRSAGLLLVFVLLACAAAPASSQMPAIAPGVSVAGVAVGGLTSEPARAKLTRAFSRAIPIKRGDRRWWASPGRLGAGAGVDAAVSRALSARTGDSVELGVTSSPAAVRRFVARVARSFDRRPVDAQLLGLSPNGLRFSKERWGVAVRRWALEHQLRRALERNRRAPLRLPVRLLRPKQTIAAFGPVIVIWRGANTLRLYDGLNLVRTFQVATGTSTYPTPSGLFSIVDKQYDPWWRPPNSDWARGLDPIPPGPGNPLGTRWMGLSAPGVGIHGTPSAASIGYSASHGCIRMRIPEAEWLFGQVTYGTPVLIV